MSAVLNSTRFAPVLDSSIASFCVLVGFCCNLIDLSERLYRVYEIKVRVYSLALLFSCGQVFEVLL